MVLFFLLPTISSLVGVIVTALSSWLIWVVKLLAHLDFLHILIGRVSLTPIVFYYCVISIIAFTYFHRPIIKKMIFIAAALTAVIFIGVVKYQQTHRDDLTLTCLDVGHGQAILAQLPGGANCLFDAGSLYNSDIGRRVVTPFLNYTGSNKIDSIIISHNDIDHLNAIPEIVANCNVKNIYADETFFDETTRSNSARFLDEYLAQKDTKLVKELNIKSRAAVKILWPSEQARQDKTLDDNDKSTVSLIEFAGKKILLCSDIEQFAQKELLRLYPNLKADIVIVPHHGSAGTLDADFLDKLQPNILICSCSRSAYEKKQVIGQKEKSQVYYTATDGAVTIHISKDGTIKTTTFAQSR